MRDSFYYVCGIDPNGIKAEWHDCNSIYGAELAMDDAFDAGWRNMFISHERHPAYPPAWERQQYFVIASTPDGQRYHFRETVGSTKANQLKEQAEQAGWLNVTVSENRQNSKPYLLGS
jgi:hypothetical protein